MVTIDVIMQQVSSAVGHFETTLVGKQFLCVFNGKYKTAIQVGAAICGILLVRKILDIVPRK